MKSKILKHILTTEDTNEETSWVWCHMSVIPATPEGKGNKDHEFNASLHSKILSQKKRN
jgi:hypothetical protein